MKITFVGSGDAFGSGGRFNTCFLLDTERARVLVDCGASSLVALRRREVDLNSIEAIIVSHLHGDHFGGLPFLLLDAALVSRRSTPLVLAGPPGLEDRLRAAMEALFPGSASRRWSFDLTFVEIPPGGEVTVCGLEVAGYDVVHRSGAPSLALRIGDGAKLFAYSGDTEWTDALVRAARHADLFVCECYMYEREVPQHLSYARIMRHYEEIAPKRLVLTHMSADMLAHLGDIDTDCAEPAEDGLVIDF